MNTVESITVSRVVSLARLNLSEATAWALHAKASDALPAQLASEIDDVRFLISLLDDAVVSGYGVSDNEALTVLQRACILYGRAHGLSKSDGSLFLS